MNPWIKILLAASGVAVVFIVINAMHHASEDAAWTHLAMARADGNSIEALETARDSAADTVAEPWISYFLAMQLYQAGEPDQLQRARQIASDLKAEHPDHALVPYLDRLIAAIDSYSA
ncbi:MAG: hypothetical protein H6825_08595 [Planctomycetes bacterium]|nr:hypothetical protein [Planctomycetota bacterium]